MKLKRIAQQSVVVFGASSGIGRLTALRFAEQGAKLVVAARGQEGLDSLVDEIESKGGKAIAVVADAADFDQVKAAAETAMSRYGALDTWVHAAGIYLISPFEKITPQEFKHIIEVNLVGQAYGAMAALPLLRQSGGGALIHVSSVDSVCSLPYHSAYAASKHGIPGFLDALRMELEHDKVPISVTNIMPAAINTPLFSKALTKIGTKPEAPPPVYQPDLVADAILHAAENPIRDMIVGGAGKAMVAGQKFMPSVTDKIFGWMGHRTQKSAEPKSETDSNSFYRPVNDQRIYGEYNETAIASCPYSWLTRHPGVKASVGLAAVGAAGAAFLLWKGSQRQSAWK